MNGTEWRFILEAIDPKTQVGHREWFIFPRDAESRAEQLRAAGFVNVRVSERRVSVYGQPSTRRPGFFPL